MPYGEHHHIDAVGELSSLTSSYLRLGRAGVSKCRAQVKWCFYCAILRLGDEKRSMAIFRMARRRRLSRLIAPSRSGQKRRLCWRHDVRPRAASLALMPRTNGINRIVLSSHQCTSLAAAMSAPEMTLIFALNLLFGWPR